MKRNGLEKILHHKMKTQPTEKVTVTDKQDQNVSFQPDMDKRMHTN